jgi:hypothetical protein
VHFESFPSYATLVASLERLVRENSRVLRFETIGTTAAGKEVLAVHAAREDLPLEEKEVVFIVCGRHGDELGTRVVGPALLHWLLSAEAAPVLAKQHLVVVPVANPDGCEKGVFGLPPDRLSSLEEETVLRLADLYIPDLIIDVHSVGREKRGLDWGGLQAVVIDAAGEAGEDRQITFKMALEAIDAACARGEFFLLHDVAHYRRRAARAAAGAATAAAFNHHLNGACYKRFHALNFGLEVNHFVRTPDEAARSGAVVIQSLLYQGSRRFAGERHIGYPNRLLKGDYLAALRAAGETAGERRRARRNLWPGTEEWEIAREMPDAETIQIHVRYSGKKNDAAEVSFFAFGRPPREVRRNGEAVSCDFVEHACGTQVFVPLEDAMIDGKIEIFARR